MNFLKLSVNEHRFFSRNDLLAYMANNPVFAFNFNDVIDLQGVVSGVQKYGVPVILMVSSAAVNFLGMDYLKSLFEVAKSKSNVPLFIQLDHAKDIHQVYEAIKLDFDIIMVDRDGKSFSDHNFSEMAQAVQGVHSKGILVEGELAIDQLNTTPEFMRPFDISYAKDYILHTGIDMLAFPCGNKHGFSRKKPSLDYVWINDIAAISRIPLVLHGADFIEPENIIRAVSAGIRKINIGPELRVEYYKGIVNTRIDDYSPDHRVLLSRSRDLIKEKVENLFYSLYGNPFEH